MKIALDAGHGGNNPGAIGLNGLQEKTVNLNVALMTGQLLKQHTNMDVYYTRSTDIDIPLANRADYANSVSADYFISFHCNSNANTSYNGTETLIYRRGGPAERLAQSVQTAIVAQLGTKNNGITERPELAVLRRTVMPAILIEMAFVSNPQNANILENRQDAVARGIYKGICAFLGLTPILPVRFTYNGQQVATFNPSEAASGAAMPVFAVRPQPAPVPPKQYPSPAPMMPQSPAPMMPNSPATVPPELNTDLPPGSRTHTKDNNTHQPSAFDEYMKAVRERFDASMNSIK